jgi:hypothetical protein
LIHLEDYGQYARWIFGMLTAMQLERFMLTHKDTPSRSTGLELHVGTEDISWADLAATFTEVTGQKAVYKDITLDEYFLLPIFPTPDAKVGSSADPGEKTLFTFRENFSGFWNTWKDDLTKRDYALLDEILPTRVKSVKEWMLKTGYDGKPAPVLKTFGKSAN